MNRKALGAIIASVTIIIGFALVGFFGENIMSFAIPREKIPSYEELSDKVILNRTNDLPEVKAFLKRNPNADIFVDRSSHFQVWHSVRESDITGDNWNDTSTVEPYVALIVRLNSTGHPESTFVWCTPGGDEMQRKITNNVLNYIKEDGCQEFYSHYQDEK